MTCKCGHLKRWHCYKGNAGSCLFLKPWHRNIDFHGWPDCRCQKFRPRKPKRVVSWPKRTQREEYDPVLRKG